MSYEGFDQTLCKNGHYHEMWANDFSDHSICPVCAEPIVWWNSVDMTNGDGSEFEVKLEELTPAKYETCNLGCVHETALPTYKIPGKSYS